MIKQFEIFQGTDTVYHRIIVLDTEDQLWVASLADIRHEGTKLAWEKLDGPPTKKTRKKSTGEY